MSCAQNGVVIGIAICRWQCSARIDNRMLTNHTLQSLHSTSHSLQSPFKLIISSHPEQTPSLKLSSPKATVLLLSDHSPGLQSLPTQAEFYGIKHMHLCKQPCQFEQGESTALCIMWIQLGYKFPGVFLFRLNAQCGRTHFKWSQFRYAGLKRGGE